MDDELIERLVSVRHSRDNASTAKREKIYVLIHIDVLDETITALREMQEENRSLSDLVQELDSKLFAPLPEEE